MFPHLPSVRLPPWHSLALSSRVGKEPELQELLQCVEAWGRRRRSWVCLGFPFWGNFVFLPSTYQL